MVLLCFYGNGGLTSVLLNYLKKIPMKPRLIISVAFENISCERTKRLIKNASFKPFTNEMISLLIVPLSLSESPEKFMVSFFLDVSVLVRSHYFKGNSEVL